MGHTPNRGGQASDQDSNSGPGRHGNNSGHIYRSARHQQQGQAHNRVTPSSPTPTLADPTNRHIPYSQRIMPVMGGGGGWCWPEMGPSAPGLACTGAVIVWSETVLYER